jgi:hypothetical protein
VSTTSASPSLLWRTDRTQCTFSGNHADDYGGVIDNSGGTLTVVKSSFSEQLRIEPPVKRLSPPASVNVAVGANGRRDGDGPDALWPRHPFVGGG